ncbi:MAG: hypothetical protein KAW47_11320 [Thermoplasmatales archaeon]|nr:hypothetical protein [Thermoplasmatales archaeon]
MIWELVASLILAFGITFVAMPVVIKIMKGGGMLAKDVNKADKRKIAEMGGIASILGFVVALSFVVGTKKIVGYEMEVPILSVFCAMLLAAFVGLFDDIALISRRTKAVMVLFAALPFMVAHPGVPSIDLPFGLVLDFSSIPLFYWLILVPIGVTGVANALNMSAGYNGLESGQIAIISFFLLVVAYLNNSGISAIMIFSALLGASLALFYFNRFPARVFVGDIGTLALGAAIGAGVIIGNIEFFGLICIIPAFYEFFATVWYGHIRKVERKPACMQPVISGNPPRLSPPKGTEKFTLAYFILGKKSMTEKNLVRVILSLYAICGFIALGLSVI